MSVTTTRKLKYPVKRHNGEAVETVDKIELRRPTAKEMLLIDEYKERPMRLLVEMVAALSDLSVEIIEQLDAEDFGFLGDAAFANVGDTPKIGATA